MTTVRAEKSIFVTGAASGIGRATARLFAERGWFVGAFDIDEAGLLSLSSELGEAEHLTRRLDVSDREAYPAAVEAFGQRTGGRMDILFNNAGIIVSEAFDEMGWETIDRILRINLLGTMTGIRSAAHLLKATPNALCFTTASASAIYGSANLSIYSATKHAVKGLTEPFRSSSSATACAPPT